MNSPYGGSKTDPHSCLDDTKGPKGENVKNEKCKNKWSFFFKKGSKSDRGGGGLAIHS